MNFLKVVFLLPRLFIKNDIIDGVYKEYYPDGIPKEISMYQKERKMELRTFFIRTGKECQ